jgi:hypothetical protein
VRRRGGKAGSREQGAGSREYSVLSTAPYSSMFSTVSK